MSDESNNEFVTKQKEFNAYKKRFLLARKESMRQKQAKVANDSSTDRWKGNRRGEGCHDDSAGPISTTAHRAWRKAMIAGWVEEQLAKRKADQHLRDLPKFQRECHAELREKKKAVERQVLLQLTDEELAAPNLKELLKARVDRRLVADRTREQRRKANQSTNHGLVGGISRPLVQYDLVATWKPFSQTYEQINAGFPDDDLQTSASTAQPRPGRERDTVPPNTLVSVKIVGSGLCMAAMSRG